MKIEEHNVSQGGRRTQLLAYGGNVNNPEVEQPARANFIQHRGNEKFITEKNSVNSDCARLFGSLPKSTEDKCKRLDSKHMLRVSSGIVFAE
ncbi:hypothetical protein BaRGS_00030161 [Batillaria attramentaria]|uniref:Uncharacterized protein n=1 Tax=Batillaria attramentaria TaxID=370345 RepID=A0ABD0JVB5_9CAEN